MNHYITSGLVLTAFKRASHSYPKEIPLNPSDTNYGLVSLFSFLSKVQVHDIYSQLLSYLSTNNLQGPNQSGFKTSFHRDQLFGFHREALCHQVNQTVIGSHSPWPFCSVWSPSCPSCRVLEFNSSRQWLSSYLDGRSCQVTWKEST